MDENPYQTPSTAARKPNEGWPLATSLTVEEASRKVESFFSREGYRLESGSTSDGYYGIGNNVLRIFLGAFVKRYRFHITIEPASNGTVVQVEKGMSGAMGGAIGYSKMKKELQRVRDEIEALFR